MLVQLSNSEMLVHTIVQVTLVTWFIFYVHMTIVDSMFSWPFFDLL